MIYDYKYTRMTMDCKKCELVGEGELECEDCVEEEEIQDFNSDKLDNILYRDGLDWTFKKPTKGKYHTIYIIKKEEEDEDCCCTKQYRKEIEEGCPEGHITIWDTYGFRYEEEKVVKKPNPPRTPKFNVINKFKHYPTHEEFMSKYKPKEDLCKATDMNSNRVHDKDIKVGDVVALRTWGRYKIIYEVSRLTKCFIIFKEAYVIPCEVKDNSGDIHTFSKYCGSGVGVEKKIKITGKTGQWDGYAVYDKTQPIWVKTGETDIWA